MPQATKTNGVAEKQPALPALTEEASPAAMDEHPAWQMVSRIPASLSVAVPVRGLRVARLLALEAGQVVASNWATTEDVPLAAGNIRLAWGEFEIANQRLALRITRIA
jgi:flagellar motor switch/type III secretory pathway protein FliN